MAFVSNTTAGCLDLSHIGKKYPAGAPIYHDPSGVCYPFSQTSGEPDLYGIYGYNPQLSVGIAFTVLFGLTFLIYTFLSLIHKPKWVLVVAVGSLGELIGWVGRSLSAHTNDASDASRNYFLIQICCLTLSPAFFSAYCYGMYATVVAIVQPETSKLSPRVMTYVFITCDIISLVLQAIGGAFAASADTLDQQLLGTHLMVSGIAFQLGIMILFSIYALEWYSHVKNPWPKHTRTLSLGIVLASALIILRGCYRTAELSQGWEGYLITHEGYFIGLDAVPMILTMVVLIATHPRFTLPLGTPTLASNSEKITVA